MSIWNKKEIVTQNECLKENIDIDVLIIGAGITGMTTAYYLKDYNSICVVDANRIGHGVTLNTTAKINYFQERVYTRIASIVNYKKAIEYLSAERYAIDKLKNIIQTENIDCDLEEVPSFVFANTKKEIKPLEKEIQFLKNNGINIIQKDLPNKITSYRSYCVNDTYIFNPIKYLEGIYNILKDKNIHIYENTKIVKVESGSNGYICHGTKHHINAKKIIFACQYPFFIYPFMLPLKSYIEKSYIIVSEVKEDGGFTCISSNSPTYSCRFYKDSGKVYQISLGESHNTAFKQNDKYHFNKVKKIFKLKDSDIVMSYNNTDIITPDHMPYIGKLKKDIYIGSSYNTWGMTNGILAANIISDMILGKENKYANSFSPNRINLSNFIKFPLIIFSEVKSYIGPKVEKNKSWYSDNVSFINKEGKSLAIYKDKNGTEHIIHNKCPHFGCSLIFNEKEKTWDCPCHSSRFNIDGKCIKGPSNYDITYRG